VSNRDSIAAEAKKEIQVKIKLTMLLVTIALLDQGCFIYKYPSTPEVTGKVVDARTGDPITNAIVGFRGHKKTFTQTTTNGSFHVLFGKRWGPAYIIPMEFTPCNGTFFAESEGYQPFEEWLTAPRYNPINLTNPISLLRISN
jgi:hypothetical protein